MRNRGGHMYIFFENTLLWFVKNTSWIFAFSFIVQLDPINDSAENTGTNISDILYKLTKLCSFVICKQTKSELLFAFLCNCCRQQCLCRINYAVKSFINEDINVLIHNTLTSHASIMSRLISLTRVWAVYITQWYPWLDRLSIYVMPFWALTRAVELNSFIFKFCSIF